LDYVCGAKHFHLSSYFLHRSLRAHIGDLFHQTKQAKLTTSLDTNDDPEGRWDDDLQKVLKHVDVFLPNEREACMIARVDNVQKAAEVLSEIVPIVVVKRGSQGALVRRGRECFTAPPPVVQSVDFVGAGDSFNAGFLHKFIRGATLVAQGCRKRLINLWCLWCLFRVEIGVNHAKELKELNQARS
jgi:sugar/nucleoside kinase (ribokinase family)